VDFDFDNEISKRPESSQQLPDTISSQPNAKVAELGTKNTSPMLETQVVKPSTHGVSYSSDTSSSDKSTDAPAKQVFAAETTDSLTGENSCTGGNNLPPSSSSSSSSIHANVEVLQRAGQTNEMKSAVSEEAARQNVLDVTNAGSKQNVPEKHAAPMGGGSPVIDQKLQKPEKDKKERSKVCIVTLLVLDQLQIVN